MDKLENDPQSGSIIKLKWIDTKSAAENFSKLLEERKTYFLNGEWGSGKTEFLKKVKESSKKKFVILDLWRITDERSVISRFASKCLRKTYFLLRLIMIVSVVISILMTDVVNLGLSQLLHISIITKIVGIITLFIAVWSFFKIKSDSFFLYIIKFYRFENMVLIIDDFDRIDVSIQEEAYRLFNILEHKVTIVFVGDYDKLAKNENRFLQKIINRRVELPFALQPKNVWNEYFDKLEDKLECKISDDFKRIVINDKRNLREREQFNDYVNNEFIFRNKLNYVQPFQQLLIIYVYLFYPAYYNNLLNDSEFGFSEEIKRQVQEQSNGNIGTQPATLHSLLYNMLMVNTDGYPYPFKKNKQGYFLYEQPINKTIEELNEFFEDDELLKQNLSLDEQSDFYEYVISHYVEFDLDRKEKLFVNSVQLVKEYQSGLLTRYILNKKNEEIMPSVEYIDSTTWMMSEKRTNKSEQDINREIYDGWHGILEKFDFDMSQEFYLLQKYSELSIHSLGELFSEINIFNPQFNNAKRRDFILMVYLSRQNLFYKVDEWSDKILEFISKLPDDQYIIFLTSQRIIEAFENCDFDTIPKDKKFNLYNKRRDIECQSKYIDYRKFISKIRPRLNDLEKKGYFFNIID